MGIDARLQLGDLGCHGLVWKETEWWQKNLLGLNVQAGNDGL